MVFQIHFGDFAHLEGDVFLLAENCPQGVGDLCGKQTCNSYLVEQRLEEMVVMPVHERDVRWGLCQAVRNFHSAEAGTDNNDMGKSFCIHCVPHYLGCTLFVKYYTIIITKR